MGSCSKSKIYWKEFRLSSMNIYLENVCGIRFPCMYSHSSYTSPFIKLWSELKIFVLLSQSSNTLQLAWIPKHTMTRAWVVVLGDVGRSPRMQYHTSSLCKTVRGKKPPLFLLLFLYPSQPVPHWIWNLADRNFAYLFAQDGYTVNLIGYRGAEVISELQAPLADGTVTLNYIPDL